jgi:hypothetical protein
MSEGRRGSGEAASALEAKDVAAAVSAPLPSLSPPPPPLASVLAFAATDADAGGGAAAAYFFDDASTIGSTGDASTLVLDSWLRDDRDGHFYCPRHPDQRKPYRPHRNSICAECLAESQRARQSLEQRKRVVEQKLQRLMDDKRGDESTTSPNTSSNSNGETNVDPSHPGGARFGFGGSDALSRVDVVMKDWTNSSLRRHAPPQDNKSEPPAPARPPEHADREAALKSAEGLANNEAPPPPPPPIVEATFHYSPPSSHPQHPTEPHMPQPPPTAGYQPPYEYYAYAPPSAGPSPYHNGQYPSYPPHLSHNLPGYLSGAPPPADPQHPTHASPPIPPQHQAPPEYPPHATAAAHASHVHPSYSEVPSHSSQQGGWAAATATYGSPAPAAPAAAAVPDAFVGHLFHMMERQDGMLVQKIKECDELKKALDEVTSQIHELRVDNAQLRERVGQQGEQMRHELDLIRREVVAAAAAAAVVPSAATATTSRPQHVHRTPSPPRGRRMRRNRTSSAEEGEQVADEPRTPLLLADSPPRAREDGANNVARDVLEMVVETEPAATSNESPFLSEENKKGLSGVKLEPRRKWTSSSPSGPDLSPPVQWFPFQSEDAKDCPFTVFVDDDNDFHDPFGVGAGAITFDVPKKGALASLKPAPATTNTAAPAAVAASHRQEIDWERSELAV